MPTILADTFTASLARLTNDEQKQVKLTAFDLQTDPERPGLKMHRIEASRDPNFWSVRVNADIRIIIHKTGDSVMLAYVDHHDDAYKWAERRRIEAHPKTGALQTVEVRERVEEFAVGWFAPKEEPFLHDQPYRQGPKLFAALSTDDLLYLGVPEDWLADVANADEESFFMLAGHLPQEAGERLLEYAATGVLPQPVIETAAAIQHPDAQRRFRVLEGHEELAAALDQPFEKWAVFLHPSQRKLVERDYSGPARVIGSAGTGKTVVALHRVKHIVKKDHSARVLLTTFSEPLAQALRSKLGILLGELSPHFERVTVLSFRKAAEELYTRIHGHKPDIVSEQKLREMIKSAAKSAGLTRFSPQFLNSEWEHVIDAWQVGSLDAYAAVPRMGRKNRLGVRQREELWSVFSAVRERLRAEALLTPADLFSAVTAHYAGQEAKPYTHIVVDEAQDLGVAELRFLSAIVAARPNALFFAGDIGQRIFQQPFSWKGLGIDIRGRSFTLKVNYRTSHQIRRMADKLIPANMRDVDGEEDERKGTISVFEGLEPLILVAETENDEIAAAAAFLQRLIEDGLAPREIGIFYRSYAEVHRALKVAERAGIHAVQTAERRMDEDAVLIGTMHLAKGLEFRAVLVIACDEGVLPLSARVNDVADEFELDEVISTERQLLYVAATRARERLFVSGVAPGSEFLDELAL
jgi:superfamily I DNA/RNA helicase